MHQVRSLLLLFLAAFSFSNVKAQNIVLSDQAAVSVITCGSGNEVYSLFGHTAIRITDPMRGYDTVYNYGAFDFDTPNFVAKFSKGDLQYFVTSNQFDQFLYSYNYERRSVLEQQLNMSQQQKQQLFDELNATLISNDRFYTYKFIDRNCTTMVVDILNKHLGGKVLVKAKRDEKTFREVLYPYFDRHFYEQLGTSIIFGTKVDQQADKIFLPIELWESVNKTTYKGQKLLAVNKTWLKFEPETPAGSWWNNVYTYLALLILIVAVNSRVVTAVYFIFAGLIGLFFTVAGFYSFHGELAWNYNALLFNPILLPMAIFILGDKLRYIYYASLSYTVMLAIYLIIMVNKTHLLIVLPVVIANLVIVGRYILRQRRTSLTT